MNSSANFQLTKKELLLLSGYFWNEDRRKTFVDWADIYLGDDDETANDLMAKFDQETVIFVAEQTT
jgi:hypothetical protein